MDNETNKYETYKPQTAVNPGNGSATAETILHKGAEALGKTEQAVGEAYDKATQKVKETYAMSKNYCTENPVKTCLVALGIGVGIGLLMKTSCSHR